MSLSVVALLDVDEVVSALLAEGVLLSVVGTDEVRSEEEEEGTLLARDRL